MTTSDATSLITAVIAAAAFLLSVYNFYVHRRDRQLRLQVWISKGTHTVTNKIKSTETSKSVLFIEIANPCDRRIVVTDADVFMRKHDIVLGATNLKDDEQRVGLLPGDNAIYFLSLASVATSLRAENITGKVEVKARVRDALGNFYNSRNSLVLNAADLPQQE